MCVCVIRASAAGLLSESHMSAAISAGSNSLCSLNTSLTVLSDMVLSCSEPLKAYFVQLAVISNHQNGRDTHIRQVKVFGPRQETVQRLMAPDIGFATPEFLMFSVVR